MTEAAPTQKKVEAGATSNENNNTINDRAGLFFGAFGMAIAFLAIGIAWQSDKHHEALTRGQEQQIAEQKKEIMLLREDVRELIIEVRGKPK